MTLDDPRRPTRTLRGVAAAALLLAAAACGTVSGVPASQAAPVSGPAAAVPAAGGPVPGGLGTAQTALGTVVTSDGFTLYRFQNDSGDPPRPTCDGGCATMWPPVLGDGVPALRGVEEGLVGTVGRADGDQQLTLGGWPLYRFATDTAPGEVNGEGVGGVWRAVGVDGKPAAAPAAPARHRHRHGRPHPRAATRRARATATELSRRRHCTPAVTRRNRTAALIRALR